MRLNICWKNGTKVLKERFKSTFPGLIQGVQHVADHRWKIKLAYESTTGKVKTEIMFADSAYIICNFGDEYLKFALQQQHQLKKDNFHLVPKKVTVRMKGKTIIKLKLIPEQNEFEMVKTNVEYTVESMKVANAKRTTCIDNALGYISPTKKSKCTKIAKQKKKRLTGKKKPAVWRVQYSDQSINDEITEEELTEKFGQNYITYIKNLSNFKVLLMFQLVPKNHHRLSICQI